MGRHHHHFRAGEELCLVEAFVIIREHVPERFLDTHEGRKPVFRWADGLVVKHQQAVYEFYQQRLFHAINIIHAIIEFDASGNFVGGAYGYMPARDWARIGQLYLQKGRWNDNQVLSEDWVSFATSPSPVAKHYGAHMWLNSDGQRWPNVPYDAFSLVGHQGQRVVIIP